jgi:hypothetical protein
MSEIIRAEIKARKNFYRNNFYRLVNTLFILGIFIAILVGLILFKYFTEGRATYYATANNGNLVKLTPVPRGTGLVIPEDQRNIVEKTKET